MKILLLALTLILAACASDQVIQNKYYLLADNATETEAPPDLPLLVVTTELADYLNSNNLLYRSSETQVIYAKHNLWAQQLSQQLSYRVINHLAAKRIGYRPVTVNSALDLNATQQLYIYLQKFNGVYTGVAEIAGEWYLLDKQGQIVHHNFFHIDVPLQQDGYNALIHSLSEGVTQLSDSIVEKL